MSINLAIDVIPGKPVVRQSGGALDILVSVAADTIITGVETSHAILGHELRHCFEGRFHD